MRKGASAMAISAGDRVLVETADGLELDRRATSSVERGRDFLVIWVCTEAEWAKAHLDGETPQAVPWPVEHVKALDEAEAL